MSEPSGGSWRVPVATPEEIISKGCSRDSLGPCIRMPMRSELGATLKVVPRRLCRDSLVNEGHWGPSMKRSAAGWMNSTSRDQGANQAWPRNGR
jgi:hypothetical protein